MDKLSLNPIHTTSSLNSDIVQKQILVLKRFSLPDISDNQPQSSDEIHIQEFKVSN